uniref:Growth-regulating factor n=1 Tax=Larix kaempferi TaxID=54800 RepID=A0A0M3LBH7_9CONI|nr:growth regulating factor 3 [Larix kaempferi]
MAMGREIRGMEMGVHGVRTGVRPPFSPAQWQELEHQALIFKYMMACVPVPPELIIPIRKSLLSLPQRSPPLPPQSHHHIPTLTPWSPFHMGFGGNIDPEPGRCRRTDGKKWRCSRDVVPDQKYCERHMHRGRHRSRKPVEGHTAAVTCQSNSTSAPAVTSSSNVLPRPASISVNSLQKLHQPGPLLGTKNLSFTGSGSQIQQYPFQSAAGAIAASSPSAMGNKDYRYVNGMKGGEMDEHILFSETSGSSTMNNQWRFMAASKEAVPHSSLSKTNSNDSLLQYSSSPQLRTLLGQNLGIMTEGSQVASIHINPHDKQHQQRQQHSFLSTDYGRVQEGMREPEEQPLRHFFDEWPRSRNPWATNVEEETSNRSSSTTQLSISIPMPSSNFSATDSSSTPRGKLSLTSLKLSMSGDGSDPLGVDPIEMGLAVGMNMNVEDRHRQTHSQHHHHHNQANWAPITWGNPMEIGGPLAEVLQSSTTPSGCNNNKPGLNLMTDIGWKDNMNNSSSSNKNSTSSHSRDSPPSCLQASSPTGVLQKTIGFVSGTNSNNTSKTES